MKLGTYFTLDEFCVSQTAIDKKIANFPSGDNVNAMAALVKNVLDPLRKALGKPIRITSGFRSAALNAAVGGSKTSDHVFGYAADIKVDGLLAREIAQTITNLDLPYDQMIAYHIKRGGHVHISFKPTNRKQTLWAGDKGGYSTLTLVKEEAK
jgi:hypothetical protein